MSRDNDEGGFSLIDGLQVIGHQQAMALLARCLDYPAHSVERVESLLRGLSRPFRNGFHGFSVTGVGLPANLRAPGELHARFLFEEPEGISGLHARMLCVIAGEN